MPPRRGQNKIDLFLRLFNKVVEHKIIRLWSMSDNKAEFCKMRSLVNLNHDDYIPRVLFSIFLTALVELFSKLILQFCFN